MIQTDVGRQGSTGKQQQMVRQLKEATERFLKQDNTFFEQEGGGQLPEAMQEILWETILAFCDHPFRTVKNLAFSYTVRGNELFVVRRDKEIVWEKKSITRATVNLAFYTALRLQKNGQKVSGPKKLGTFGASYLYPVFLCIGAISMY